MTDLPYIDPRLPLIDLHRHLDGSVRLETVLELADAQGIELPASDVDGLRPFVVIEGKASGLMDFIGRFQYLTAILHDLDACRRVAYENVEDARNEGIDYIELRFSPWFMSETHELDPAGVVEAVADGIMAAERDTGIRAQMIGIMSRTYDTATCHRELDALLAHRDHLVAIDLAGDEVKFPAGLFREHFQRARDAGLQVTVHAGEADGPDSVWAAIRELGATRIGHGIHSLRDPALVDYLGEHRIGLEVNITSNIHTGTVDDYINHPAKKIFELGLLANLNTDDPAISGIDLPYEYEQAALAAGLTPEMTRQSQINALEMAFLSAEEKSRLQQKKLSG
ncbi:MAG: adenosine deaminase [Xanthomonadales bacterium]|jgi:adenosine deaminase|nr:adenosine deaminase [Xanthomonadales bacterium]MDH3924983.1 adenosine deaminase [Xanthomonadales bacterium]MDH3939635.1 adenosine deaminase [Xanthomonadales bacterium]MDH4002147.1 adenosine deaminase [Xanthomonadales bacterium]